MEASQLQSECCGYINDLPDNVLHHILSFLPVKDCIRTSFLSRRWRYLWTSVPNLDFDGFVFSPKVKFMNFVDSVLHRRNDCGMQKFRLRFGDYYCASFRVHSWIVSAVTHNVRELSISSHTTKPFDDLPSCIFSCRSLEMLTLNLFYCDIKLPSSSQLPFLKTLELSSVIISDDNLSQFFSNCPMLENVSMLGCFVRNLTTLHISSPHLQKLSVDGVPQSVYSKLLLNEIRISAPRLLSLEFRDKCLEGNSSVASVNISLENMSSLVNAFMDFNIKWDNTKQCARRVTYLLRGLSNVKVLTLSSEIIQLLTVAPDLLRQLPTFSNLNHLKVSATGSDDTTRVVTCFLHKAPNLEFLSMDLLRRWYWLDNEECFESLKVDSAIDHLKIVKMREFRGDEKELSFVKFLLQRASVLEKMIIVFSKQLSTKSERQMEVRENILKHPRSSVTSEVIWEPTFLKS